MHQAEVMDWPTRLAAARGGPSDSGRGRGGGGSVARGRWALSFTLCVIPGETTTATAHQQNPLINNNVNEFQTGCLALYY